MGVWPQGAECPAYVRFLAHTESEKLSRSKGFRRHEAEDLKQELLMAVWRKRHLYDSARGAFDTFAAKVVISTVKMKLRDRRRIKRGSMAAVMPRHRGHWTIDVTTDHRTGRSSPDPASDVRMDVAQALSTLPPSLKHVAEELMRDDGVKRIAAEAGKSRQRIYAAIEQLRKRFTDAELGR